MFDLVRVVALLVAAWTCLRARHGLGLVLVAAMAGGEALALLGPWLHPDTAPPTLFFAFGVLLWGPSCLPVRADAPRLWSLAAVHPVARTAGTAALAAIAASTAFARSRPLRPEIPEARAWDRAGLSLVFVAVFETLLVVAGLLVSYAARP